MDKVRLALLGAMPDNTIVLHEYPEHDWTWRNVLYARLFSNPFRCS